MNYGRVINLAETARNYGLLPNPFLKNLLMCALFFDDDILVNDAEEYITFKVLDRISSGYRAKF